MIEEAMTSRILIKFISILGFCIIVAACQNTAIDNYETKSLDERMIIDVLKQYKNSRNAFNISHYLDCMHPNGRFSFMGDHILSKSDLEKALPRFWKRLQMKDTTIYPIARESITGDFFDIWNFSNIKISMDTDMAIVSVMCASSWICRQSHFISLKKTNGIWMISETAWEHF